MVRAPPGDRPDDASVWLADELDIAVKRLVVVRLTPTELQLDPTSGPTVRLERAVSSARA